jgi:ribosomal-protein-alanine N-acetyltransferase
VHNFQYGPIFMLSDSDHIGCCGLPLYAADSTIPELGFHLRPKDWGRELALEATPAAIQFAFGTVDTKGPAAGHHPENANSKIVMAMLGFSTHMTSFSQRWERTFHTMC